MKRLLTAALFTLIAVLPAYAQIAGGSISGTVTDQQKGVLPGVAVTIQGSDRTLTAVTDETGKFRFLNQPPGNYNVSFELAGFRGVKHEGVVVAVGRDADLSVSLSLATVAESITVTGESPIVDTKVTGTATNFTTDELTKIPTSRDPFALMRSVPGVLVDRVNIGGNETGQQSNFASKGTRPQDASWTMDGIEITDMTATGASPSYFNFDNFEEIQVSTAGNDIKSRTGGMGLNLVVKRGTNSFSGDVPRLLRRREHGVATTCPTSSRHGRDARDLGSQQADLGLRLRPRRPDSRRQGVVLRVVLDPGRPPRPSRRRAGRSHELKNPTVKLNWQATKNDMISFLYFDGFKIKDGRSPGVTGIVVRRADGDVPPGQLLHRQPVPRPVEDR